jgi:pimeloyl-ACP methyl ester carboxylesterase
MPYTKIDGIDIYYEIHGQGEPLVLLHHGTASIVMWEKLLPGFASRYRVIMYDRRGFGKSGKEGFPEYYKNPKYTQNSVDEMSEFLDYLDLKEKFYLLCQCEGGVTGFHYAAQHPDKVKAIAISSTMCCSNAEASRSSRRPPRPQQPPEGRVIPSLDNAEPKLRESMIHWQGEEYAPAFFKLFVEGGGAYVSVDGKPFDVREACKNVQCPALVLYPDRSRLFDVEQAVLMYRALPQGELAVLPHCGHNTYSNMPEEYQRIVLSFFARHS